MVRSKKEKKKLKHGAKSLRNNFEAINLEFNC